MGFSPSLAEPFYTGLSASAIDVPAVFPAAIAGHRYMLDLRQYRRESIPVIRQQADSSDEPGEQSFNPFALFRRSTESWHKGAGQRFFDLRESERSRFRSSKGIDPWTPGQISLLHATDQKLSSAATNLKMCVAGSRLYVLDGQTAKYTTDITPGSPSWTSVTGTPAETPTSITTDGRRVWIAYPSAPYLTDTGVSTAATFGTQDVTLVAYTNGRLVAADDNVLYELDASGAPTTLFTHPNTGFTWDVVASTPNALYAAGHSGTQGEVYRLDVDDVTTALAAPTAATALPDGEYVTALAAYVGVIVIGTNMGVRLATADTAGNLDYGPLIRTTSAVNCLEGEDRFVWFGWTAYDGTSSGLGRLDLSQFTGTLRPAYASDLMVTSQAAVRDVVTFNSRRVFTVSGSGVWGEETTPVASGTIDSGILRWGTTDSKYVHSVEVRTEPLPSGGSVTALVAFDDGTFEGLGAMSNLGATKPSAPFSARLTESERAEVRFTLAASATTPTMLRWTAEALVAPKRSERITVPIMLSETVTDLREGQHGQDTAAEFRFLKGLESAGAPVTYQEGDEAWQVTIEAVSFVPDPGVSWTNRNAWLNGTCLVTLQTIEG